VLPSNLGCFPRGLLGLVVRGGWGVQRVGQANSFWLLGPCFPRVRGGALESLRIGKGSGQRGVGRGLTVRPKCRLDFPDSNLLIRTHPTALLISTIFVEIEL